MLILGRRPQETIFIGEGENRITLTVLGIYRGQVKIGIDAPKDVLINRQEVEQRAAPAAKTA